MNKNLKIAFISYWSCPLLRLGVLQAGGMNVYVLNLVNQLGLTGNKIDIFTRSHKSSDERVLKVNENVRIVHLSVDGKDHSRNVKEFSRRITEYIKSKKIEYQLIHAHYFYSGLVAINIKKEFNLPIIQTFHTLAEMKKKYGGIIDQKRIASELKIIKYSDGIIASTEVEEKDLVEYYHADKSKIYVVQPGVNHHIFKPINKTLARLKLNLPQNIKIILFIGRIDPIKSINTLIEAADLLSKTYRSFQNKFRILLIGGDINSRIFWQHTEVIKIKNLIENKNLSCCAKFLGSQPHHLLPLYYSAADVTVLPSVYESFGLVILEAMACRSTVIASKVGGLKSFIKDKVNGLFFKSGDHADLAKILWSILHDNILSDKLAKAAYRTSQKYCWDIQAKKIFRIYQNLS